MPNATIIHGDAQHLPLADCSVDAVVCDPPYELGFMGRTWDSTGVAYDVATWREAYRVMKPGAFLVAFGGTRTFHRMTCAIEDAGFEIRDSIGYGHSVPVMAWLTGSGFPKSLDVSKAIDKAAGAEREPGEPGRYTSRRPRAAVAAVNAYQDGVGNASSALVTAPATDDARRWQGFGTALKPAWEPIVVARKPLQGTVAANVLQWGCGALNVDATRVCGPTSPGSVGSSRGYSTCYIDPWREAARTMRNAHTQHQGLSGAQLGPDSALLASALAHAADPTSVPGSQAGCLPCRGCDGGRARLAAEAARDAVALPNGAHVLRGLRWIASRIRANQCADHPSSWDALARLVEAEDGVFAVQNPPDNDNRNVQGRWPTNVVFSHVALTDGDGDIIGDACADGCVDGCVVAELDAQSGTRPGAVSNGSKTGDGMCGTGTFKIHAREQRPGYADTGGASRFFPVFRYQAKAPARERPKVNGVAHPTVKPVNLLRWMVRLVGGQPGSTILDPFAGSGTTLEAALLEGFNAVGVERSAEYLPLIQQRIDRATAPTAPVVDDVAEPTLFDVA